MTHDNMRMAGALQLPVLALIGISACNSETEKLEPEIVVGTVVSGDGVPIAYSDHGQGTSAVVLVHGWSCDRSYWSEQVGPLSRHYRVVTVDLGGHGESGSGRADWTIASFGADVAAVVESLGLESVVLVGHSMGGDVIFQAARLLSDRVDALIMVDTYKQLGVWKNDSEIDEIIEGFKANFSAATEAFVRDMFPVDADSKLVNRVANDMAAAPPNVALSAVRSSLRHAREMPALINELDVPVAAINPDDAPTDLESMCKHGVKVVIMNGVGHFLMMEDSDRFNTLLLSTLDELL